MKRKVKRIVEEKAIPAAREFHNEFKRQIVTGITAGFAFLIALSWREPISEAVNLLIERFGVNPAAGMIYKFVSAILVTLLATIGLVFLSKWSVKDKGLDGSREKD